MENIITLDWNLAFQKLDKKQREKITGILSRERIITDEEACVGRYFFSHLGLLLMKHGYEGNLLTAGKHYNHYGTVYALYDSGYFDLEAARKRLDNYVENRSLSRKEGAPKLFMNKSYTKGYDFGFTI